MGSSHILVVARYWCLQIWHIARIHYLMFEYILESSTAEDTVFQAVTACSVKCIGIILFMESYQQIASLVINLRRIG